MNFNSAINEINHCSSLVVDSKQINLINLNYYISVEYHLILITFETVLNQ